MGDKEFALEGGDYASVPPGAAHSFIFTSHRTRLLTWTFGGNGAAMYTVLGQPSDAVTYSTRAEPPDRRKPLPGVDVEFLVDESSTSTPGKKSSVVPGAIEPYVIAGETVSARWQAIHFSHFSPISARAAASSSQ
jgi:hypothetical protein